jgi:transposase
MNDAERQQLLDQIALQAAEIVLLKQTIDALCRRIFGTKSEAIDPAQLELWLNPDAAKKEPAAGTPDDVPAAEEPHHKPESQKQPRPPRIPEHLPLIEKTIHPAEVLADPAAWRRIGEEVREQLHFKRAEFQRIRLIRAKYVRIGDALAKPVISPLPPSLQDRCIATPALIAEVIDNRFVCHLPYYRQAEMFARMGVPLHRKTLCDWALLASDWLSAIYREIEFEHWRSPYRQLDETPIDYLEPGNGKARTGYLWTSNIPGGSVLYRWRKGRDQGGIGELFDKSSAEDNATDPPKCIIQCDGYVAYPAWARDKSWIVLMGCHAHVRRKFFEAKDQSPKLVGWILRQLAHLYRVEQKLRESGARPVLREALRASQSRLIHQRLKKLFNKLALRKSILPKSQLGKAISYAINQWDRLVVYLSDGRIEIDNNLVENAIRPTKLGAKNWLFIGREASGQKSAILYTIVENCRRLGINPREYVEDVLTRLPSMKANEVIEITPAKWLASRNLKTRNQAA